MSENNKLLECVRSAWRNACEGGYGEELRALPLDELAGDMIAYDDDVSACAPACEDDPEFLDYVTLEAQIVAILPQVMRECVDEGCPHHGTPHECIVTVKS